MKEYTIIANVELTKVIKTNRDVEELVYDEGELLKEHLQGKSGFFCQCDFDDVQINSYKVFELDKN